MQRPTVKERWSAEGGYGEVLRLAWPLILSNSVWTLEITADRMMLSWYSSEAVAASMAGILIFWTPLILLQSTANYAMTFVAQYLGAGRPHRIGPVVWQALYFSLFSGLAFFALVPLAPWIIAIGEHSPELQELEIIYFETMAWGAMPFILVAAVSGFFAGRGDSWTVLWINTVGFVLNVVLDYAWIFGRWGFPELGIAGAGWSNVIGTWVSAIFGLALMFRPRFAREFHTLSGWRFDRALFARLMRFGLPSGLQWMLDGLAFTAFILYVGRFGPAELAATSITFTINMVAVLPMLGMAQAVSVLVGQRLGQDRPDLAERSTWSGFQLAWSFMTLVAALYVLAPGLFLMLFASDQSPEKWAAVAVLVPALLRFVAVYSLFDSMNLIFSFALKGAGDTRFVTIISLVLAWPMMVLPTYFAWKEGWGLYWAWAFASVYVIAIALVFLWRFRQGKWKSMRVIESAPPVTSDEVDEGEREAVGVGV